MLALAPRECKPETGTAGAASSPSVGSLDRRSGRPSWRTRGSSSGAKSARPAARRRAGVTHQDRGVDRRAGAEAGRRETAAAGEPPPRAPRSRRADRPARRRSPGPGGGRPATGPRGRPARGHRRGRRGAGAGSPRCGRTAGSRRPGTDCAGRARRERRRGAPSTLGAVAKRWASPAASHGSISTASTDAARAPRARREHTGARAEIHDAVTAPDAGVGNELRGEPLRYRGSADRAPATDRPPSARARNTVTMEYLRRPAQHIAPRPCVALRSGASGSAPV